MIWTKAMKYPALMMGAIMFTIFLTNDQTQRWWGKVTRRYVPSTCDALESRIAPKAPINWDIHCPTTDKLILKIELSPDQDIQSYRVKMYKIVANTLHKFAHLANPETLEYLKIFELNLVTDKLDVVAYTDGEAMVKFRELKSKKSILEHLKLTVKTKEVFK